MKAPMLSLSVVMMVCLVLVAGCAAPPPAAPIPPTPPPPTATPVPPTKAPPTAAPASAATSDVLKAYDEAFNRHDVAAVLALFADDGFYFQDTGFLTTSKKADLQGYLEHQFGLGSVNRTGNCTGSDDSWKCQMFGHDDCIKVWGDITDAQADAEVKVLNGKIKWMLLTAIPAHMKLFTDKYPKVEAWAKANQPDDWKALGQASGFGRATGEAWSRICKGYLASQK